MTEIEEWYEKYFTFSSYSATYKPTHIEAKIDMKKNPKENFVAIIHSLLFNEYPMDEMMFTRHLPNSFGDIKTNEIRFSDLIILLNQSMPDNMVVKLYRKVYCWELVIFLKGELLFNKSISLGYETEIRNCGLCLLGSDIEWFKEEVKYAMREIERRW